MTQLLWAYFLLREMGTMLPILQDNCINSMWKCWLQCLAQKTPSTWSLPFPSWWTDCDHWALTIRKHFFGCFSILYRLPLFTYFSQPCHETAHLQTSRKQESSSGKFCCPRSHRVQFLKPEFKPTFSTLPPRYQNVWGGLIQLTLPESPPSNRLGLRQ